MTQHLFAPWRGAFIRAPKTRGCIFCHIFKAKRDAENLILHRGKQSFVVLNRYPYTSGHLMIVPFRHQSSFDKVSKGVLEEVMSLSQTAVRALQKEFSPSGFNLGMNLGRSAGAGIAGHIHMHVVPRWAGDSNFMMTAAATRVISLSLEDVYDALHKYFEKL